MRRGEQFAALVFVLGVSACDGPSAARRTIEPTGPSLAAVADKFRSFGIPTRNSQPRHITLGADGAMWFTESVRIGRVDAKGKITEFLLPDTSAGPDDIVRGPDDALWFTIPAGFPDAIGRITTSGAFSTFGTCNAQQCFSIVPHGITSGPDGNLWFTESAQNTIGKLTPSGVFTFFAIPTADANPQGITVGPDGALWFAEFGANRIGRIDVSSGAITEFGAGSITGSPDRITSGPDGNLWFTEPFPFDSRIGRMTPSGIVTEFQLANDAQPRDIVGGPDGNLWFTEYGALQLARITPTGVVTEVQPVKGGPWGIGRGADGTLWLTQFDGGRIGRYTLAP
jgi:virginiamycin B lyase